MVRVGCMDGYADGIVVDVIQKQLEQYPKIVLDIEIGSTGSVIAMMLEGEVDLAVAFNVAPRKELHVLHSCVLPFGCIAAPDHPLASKGSVSLQECGRYPMVLQSDALVIGRILQERYSWILGNQTPHVTNSIQLIKALVKTGKHIAFLTCDSAYPERRDGTLNFCEVRDTVAEPETISIVIDSRRPLKRIVKIISRLFMDQIEQSIARTGTAPVPLHLTVPDA